MDAIARRVVAEHYRDLAGRRAGSSRGACILAVAAVLAVVTFALVYLTTLSFIAG